MTLNIDPETDKVLREIQKKIGAATRTEVLRRSIALLQLAANQQRPDGTVVIKGEQAGLPTEMPVLLG